MIFTFKIIQTPREIVMLHETGDPPRQIHTDGGSGSPTEQHSGLLERKL
jgi:hypothetical protein